MFRQIWNHEVTAKTNMEMNGTATPYLHSSAPTPQTDLSTP